MPMSLMLIGELAASILLGLVFMASAIPKLRHPRGFVLVVVEYRVLPPHLSRLYARLVPPLEFLVALLVLTGTAVRSAAVVMALLLLSFIVAVGINVARGRDLDCHCFGPTMARPIGRGLVLQDLGLLAASGALVGVAERWGAVEPWSLFTLSGVARGGSLIPLLSCVAVTACAAALLGRTADGRRRYERRSVRTIVSKVRLRRRGAALTSKGG
jgi:uncharacterized membrane protein YphA (DoxX/SURF4 family)